MVWIPLQCGVPTVGTTNSYSTAMVTVCKTGGSPSNGAPSKVDHEIQMQLISREKTNVIIERKICNRDDVTSKWDGSDFKTSTQCNVC